MQAVSDPTAVEAIMSTYMLELPARQTGTAQWAAVAFVASYSSPGTRQAYSTQLRLWFNWCDRHGNR